MGEQMGVPKSDYDHIFTKFNDKGREVTSLSERISVLEK